MELLLHLDRLLGALLLDQEHHELVEGPCLQVRVVPCLVVQQDLCQVGQLAHLDLEELEVLDLEELAVHDQEGREDLVLVALAHLDREAQEHYLFQEAAEGPFLEAQEHYLW